MNSWNKTLGLGVDESLNTKEKRRSRILNLATYISLFHSVFFLLYDGILGILDIEKTITLTSEFLLFSLILYLQWNRFYFIARILFFAVVFSILFYHCNYAFRGFYGEYQYIVLPLMSLFFFDQKHIHITLLIASILSFYLPNHFYDIYPNEYFGYFNVLLLFIGLFILVSYFKNENDKNELLLEKERDKVLEDKILLEQQKRDLKELNRFKSHFFTNITHEIRTPITLIKGYADRLILTDNNTENAENLGIIQSQAKNIEGIVNDLLDLSKIDANQLLLRTTPEELTGLVERMYGRYSKIFRDKGINLYLEINTFPIEVEIDKYYFEKSLQNILENALKFTSNKGEVIIAIDYEKSLEISIYDNGIGIPEKDLENVFKRFYQSDNEISKSEGSGIGLSFAKNIIEKHGFEINVNSTLGVETKFTISVPNQYIVKHKIDHTNHTSPSSLNPKEVINQDVVLVVEDNVEMQNYLKLVLKDYRILVVSNGHEALKILKKESPSAIITDFMMPIMDGMEFIKELQNLSIKIPVIVLTARNEESDRLKMLRIGIDAYFTKPFIEEELLLRLSNSINYYRQIQSFEQNLPESEKLNLSNQQSDFYEQMLSIIEENYSSKSFGVEQLAEIMNISRSSLFRKTKFILGQTPNDVIKEMRFQKARLLLIEHPKMSKKELADAVGIYNATYFFNNLKNRFNRNDAK